MTGRSQHPAVLTQRIAVDPTRIPSTPPGVPSYRDEIASAAATIAERFNPDRVVLFGSRASGTPRPDSDIDLMVVMDTAITRSLSAHAETIRRAADVDLPVRLQVLVRHPDDIASRLAEGDFFIKDVILKGITLYARDGTDRPPTNHPLCAPSADQPTGIKIAARDWLEKATRQENAAQDLRSAADPHLSAICFWAQQAALNQLKGILQQHAIRFPRTHNLVMLAALVAPLIPDFAALEDDLRSLDASAADYFYPNRNVDAAQTDAALRTMTTVREIVHAALGSSEGDQA